MLLNKREILQPMLDKIDPRWWIKRPPLHDPCDVDYMCIFQHTAGHREATVQIRTPLFTDGKLVEIERLVRVAVANASGAASQPALKRYIDMRRIHSLAWSFLSIWLSACASFQAAGDIAQGRQALIAGNNQSALGYFQAAEQVDPAYVSGTELRQGVLSYLGRAQYLTGNYAQARSTLETALSQNQSDNIARLYLGLALARQGETQKALPDIDGGMKGIYDLLNYITDTFAFGYGQYWDPGRVIRSAIEKNRAVMASGKIDWPTLIAEGESIALKTEREPDQARQNRRTQQSLHAD